MTNQTEPAEANIERLDGQARMHRLEFEGRGVCWRAFGDGPPLVLLHGGHGNWLHWVRNIEALATRFTVWVPDLPGYGDSGEAGPYGLNSLVDATVATLNKLIGPETPIHLVAFSFGSLVAVQLALRRGHVARLVLLGAVGHGGVRRPRGELRNWRVAARSGNTAVLKEVMQHNLLMLMLHDPAAMDALALLVHTDACQRTRFRSRDHSHGAGLVEVLARYPGPLLLVWGEHDVTGEPAAVAQTLSAGRLNARTHLFQGAGHWVQFERAEAVNTLLLDWLGSKPAPENSPPA
jgi:pimeloyl-ACP methyl ester carboxylesterase